MLGGINCQIIANIANALTPPVPNNLADTISNATKPLLDILEPYKVHESTRERGVPLIHNALGK